MKKQVSYLVKKRERKKSKRVVKDERERKCFIVLK